jgi:hypothetical protein
MNFIFYLIITVVILLGLLALYFRNRISGKKSERQLTNYEEKLNKWKEPGGYAQDILNKQGYDRYNEFLNTRL